MDSPIPTNEWTEEPEAIDEPAYGVLILMAVAALLLGTILFIAIVAAWAIF